MPLTTDATSTTAMSGLAVLFAAIDYHQASNQASSSPTSFAPPKRALNPTKRGADVDVKWIDNGNLPIKKRKLNRRSWERSNFKKNKKVATDDLALPASLSYSVPSSPNSVHSTAIVSVSSSDGPDHDDSSSIESSLTAPEDLATLDVDSTRNASVEAATSEQTMPTLPIISFDQDQLAALLEQQQQRLYVSIQKTEHSRALLHDMRRTSSFES